MNSGIVARIEQAHMKIKSTFYYRGIPRYLEEINVKHPRRKYSTTVLQRIRTTFQ